MDEKTLEELAVQEILKDLKRGAERAKEHGALGWQKNPAPPPNKRFLRNMLVSTLRDNRPFKHKHDSQSHHPGSSHRDSPPRRTSESETYFRYNDRYDQSKNSHDNGNNHRKNMCSSSQGCNNGFSSESHSEGKYSGKPVQESGLQSAEREIDISDFNHKSQYWKKRSRSSSSDSECVEEKGEENDQKKRKTERHRKTDSKDERHSREKKKHKKSKKSKKHKSKHSRHRSKH